MEKESITYTTKNDAEAERVRRYLRVKDFRIDVKSDTLSDIFDNDQYCGSLQESEHEELFNGNWKFYVGVGSRLETVLDQYIAGHKKTKE